jgi:hypothetical protein
MLTVDLDRLKVINLGSVDQLQLVPSGGDSGPRGTSTE